MHAIRNNEKWHLCTARICKHPIFLTQGNVHFYLTGHGKEVASFFFGGGQEEVCIGREEPEGIIPDRKILTFKEKAAHQEIMRARWNVLSTPVEENWIPGCTEIIAVYITAYEVKGLHSWSFSGRL